MAATVMCMKVQPVRARLALVLDGGDAVAAPSPAVGPDPPNVAVVTPLASFPPD